MSISGPAGPPRNATQFLKDVALFAAAPFVTLTYILLFPFIAAAMLRQAWRNRKAAG